MNDNDKVKYLVVDTSAFIKNVPLQEIGRNVITDENVINEIKSKRQLKRLVVLPYDLIVKEAFTENVKFVGEFAKKTGDYGSLSATDIKVIALTYQLEKEHVGTSHLRDEPAISRTVDPRVERPSERPESIAGFYFPENENETKNSDEEENCEDDEFRRGEKARSNEGDIEDRDDANTSDVADSAEKSDDSRSESSDDFSVDDRTSEFETLNNDREESKAERERAVDDALPAVRLDIRDEEDSDDGNGREENEDEDGWITPGNVTKAIKSMDLNVVKEEKPAIVACMTTDFAMQNVLMQIGLNVAALDGRVIKQMRTFIFRCYACFKTTSIMTKVFCPSCGLKTLKKVAISLDEDGERRIHINFRKPLSSKGKRFSLPTPKGGKHAINPILCEDQPVPDQRLSRLARKKNDPLNDDYIAGYSPFVTRDVNSRSAILGIRSGGGVKYWMKKNPNESHRRRK